ncbi:Dihydropteroate synthase [Panus rudis PR-1116 ss-1]|nr:Dihydropteroate synthase [Panus rudis PR-1116 ss-1]
MVAFTDGAQWESDKPKLQPVHVTVEVVHDITRTADTDDLQYSLDYSELCKSITAACEGQAFASLESLLDHISERSLQSNGALQKFSLSVVRLRGLLHPVITSIETTRVRPFTNLEATSEILSIHNLEVRTIVGINKCEREETQLVRFDVRFARPHTRDTRLPFRDLERRLRKHIEESSFLTLEALASFVAYSALKIVKAGTNWSCTVKAAKLSALVCAEAPEIEITRSLSEHGSDQDVPFSDDATPQKEHSSGKMNWQHIAAIAIGSNLGDSFANIELALRLLEAHGVHFHGLPDNARVDIIDTSFLYETKPMYVSDQPNFVNGACLIDTNLAPLQLLTLLKRIETIVGRVASIRNGPRAIDLDIVLYEERVMDTRPVDERSSDDLEGHLVIPHPKLAEREFVLRPLNDIIPTYVHPKLGRTVSEIFRSLNSSKSTSLGGDVMQKVTPFPEYPISVSPTPLPTGVHLPNIPAVPPTATHWKFPVDPSTPHRTYVMGTLNATPDSFSDGSVNNTIPAGLDYVKSAVTGGADIVDIGGYSTRPGAAFVSTEEEISRVVPMIQAIRSQSVSEEDPDATVKKQARNVLISVDTFRLEVAEQAVRAGANCINDVYAFTGPEYPVTEKGEEHLKKMRQVARDLAVPVILMHSRGEASANKDYSSWEGSVVKAVQMELGEKVDKIVKGKGGVRRWSVIVDPGIGFSKTVEGNLELLRNSASITADVLVASSGLRNPLAGYPILIAPSRKSFLGTLLQKPDSEGTYAGRDTHPTERGWATAAVIACAVQQRAALVRVHDVMEMGDVVRIASALWGQLRD